MTIPMERAIENLKVLGFNFALKMRDYEGKEVDHHTPVMNGLAAYYILNLKGEYAWLDESVDTVVRIAYDMALEMMKDKVRKGSFPLD